MEAATTGGAPSTKTTPVAPAKAGKKAAFLEVGADTQPQARASATTHVQVPAYLTPEFYGFAPSADALHPRVAAQLSSAGRAAAHAVLGGGAAPHRPHAQAPAPAALLEVGASEYDDGDADAARFRQVLDHGLAAGEAGYVRSDSFLTAALAAGAGGAHDGSSGSTDPLAVADAIVARVRAGLPELADADTTAAAAAVAPPPLPSLAYAHLPRFAAGARVHMPAAAGGQALVTTATADALDRAAAAADALAAQLGNLAGSTGTGRSDTAAAAAAAPRFRAARDEAGGGTEDEADIAAGADAGLAHHVTDLHAFRDSLLRVVRASDDTPPASLRSDDVVQAVDAALAGTSFTAPPPASLRTGVAGGGVVPCAAGVPMRAHGGALDTDCLRQQVAAAAAANDAFRYASAAVSLPSVAVQSASDAAGGGADAEHWHAVPVDVPSSLDEDFARVAEAAVRASVAEVPGAASFLEVAPGGLGSGVEAALFDADFDAAAAAANDALSAFSLGRDDDDNGSGGADGGAAQHAAVPSGDSPRFAAPAAASTASAAAAADSAVEEAADELRAAAAADEERVVAARVAELTAAQRGQHATRFAADSGATMGAAAEALAVASGQPNLANAATAVAGAAAAARDAAAAGISRAGTLAASAIRAGAPVAADAAAAVTRGAVAAAEAAQRGMKVAGKQLGRALEAATPVVRDAVAAGADAAVKWGDRATAGRAGVVMEAVGGGTGVFHTAPPAGLYPEPRE